MKKKIAVIIAVVCLLTTGCTKTLTDGDKKPVMNTETGQNLTSNILCLPEDENLLDKYKKYESSMEVKLEDLPKCTEMKVYEKNILKMARDNIGNSKLIGNAAAQFLHTLPRRLFNVSAEKSGKGKWYVKVNVLGLKLKFKKSVAA